MEPAKVNFKIYQGSTFLQQLRWESTTKTYIPIIAIEKSAPAKIVVESSANLPPLGWRVRVSGVGGMKEINMPEDNYEILTGKTGSTIELNRINSTGYTSYTNGGVLEFNTPVNLFGYTARMDIRTKIGDTSPLLSLTTENGGITLDNTLKTISVTITAEATSTFNFNSAVYDLELIRGSEVTRFLEGNITLSREVTR